MFYCACNITPKHISMSVVYYEAAAKRQTFNSALRIVRHLNRLSRVYTPLLQLRFDLRELSCSLGQGSLERTETPCAAAL